MQRNTNQIIVALSGGKASAWCAGWALKRYPANFVTLYFNDTKWEHPDLYRFLGDLEQKLQHPIVRDSDGRNPEQLFIDHHSLANNRMPFCSRILKAERLQRYYIDGDTLVFGISNDEYHRAHRIRDLYNLRNDTSDKVVDVSFPLIEENVSRKDVDAWLEELGIKQPELYDLGFAHNNCSGGCVRAGKKHWKLLLDKLPEVYQAREKTEELLRIQTGKDISIFKDETLKHFRERMQNEPKPEFSTEESAPVECIGFCSSIN